MAARRRHIHSRRPFLKVTEAETTADLGALTGRLRRAIHEAEVLGLADLKAHLHTALDCALGQATRSERPAGQASEAKSIGQHEAETV